MVEDAVKVENITENQANEQNQKQQAATKYSIHTIRKETITGKKDAYSSAHLFRCDLCKKVFTKSRALGGHKSKVH